jgi:hypothetical protein
MSNGSHTGDVDPEQEAILRDYARNSAPEANMYGYTEGYHTGQANGTLYKYHT